MVTLKFTPQWSGTGYYQEICKIYEVGKFALFIVRIFEVLNHCTPDKSKFVLEFIWNLYG